MHAEIKFFKSFKSSICLFLLIWLIFSIYGFSFKEGRFKPALENLRNKIKAKINYSENPNPAEFFLATDLSKYNALGSKEALFGHWFGTFNLEKNSIIWINQVLDKEKVYDLIEFGPYNLHMKFNLDDNKLLGLNIAQEEISYESVNFEKSNDKQISYWTKATNKNWLEVIRGKVLRLNHNELFTEFRTTVYENKIPIYAFSGEVVLKKME